MRFLTALALSMTLSSAVSFAFDGWERKVFTSTEGNQIQVDYKVTKHVYSLGPIIAVQPFWFNVTGPGVNPGSQVRVVFMNYDRITNRTLNNLSIDLQHAGGGRFTADYPFGFQVTNASAQEVAVVIDGRWQKDPINGTSNFKFVVYRPR